MKGNKMNTGMDKKTEWTARNVARAFAVKCEDTERKEGRRWVAAKDSKSAGHYEYLHADGNWKTEKPQ
jgi:hypothetical protein